jgi:hypothetical protein
MGAPLLAQDTSRASQLAMGHEALSAIRPALIADLSDILVRSRHWENNLMFRIGQNVSCLGGSGEENRERIETHLDAWQAVVKADLDRVEELTGLSVVFGAEAEAHEKFREGEADGCPATRVFPISSPLTAQINEIERFDRYLFLLRRNIIELIPELPAQ